MSVTETLFKPIDELIRKASANPDTSNSQYRYQDTVNNEISNAIKSVNSLHNVISNEAAYQETMKNSISAFNKYKIQYPDMHINRAIPYVFFTRPDLNFYKDSNNTELTDHNKNDPLISGLHNSDELLMKTLTMGFSCDHHFNPFLSNMALSFDLQDESIESLQTGDTFTGWRVKYGRHNTDYKSSGSFNVTYTDTNKLQIYKLHKAWVEYISKVYRGEIESKAKYIQDRRLDYACSVYYFLCAPDGETILYWAKYVGVFPSTVPTGVLAWSKGSLISSLESSVTYQYSWKSDMELPIIRDFNYNSGIEDERDTEDIDYSKSYNDKLIGAGYAFAKAPFIRIESDEEGRFVFKLKFKKMVK